MNFTNSIYYKLFPLLFMLSIAFCGSAQDLLVRSNGDSIVCKIKRVGQKKINYLIDDGVRVVAKRITKRKVESFTYDFFNAGQSSADFFSLEEDNEKQEDYEPPIFDSKWKVALLGGWSYRPYRLPDQGLNFILDYYQELKFGWMFGAEFTAFVAENSGISTRFTSYRTSNSIAIVVIDTSGIPLSGQLSDDVVINYYAIGYTSRNIFESGNMIFSSSVFAGLLTYNNQAAFIDPYRLEGRALGISFGLALEYMIDFNIALGVDINYTTGTLSKVEYTDENTKATIRNLTPDLSLNRLDISGGLKFYF